MARPLPKEELEAIEGAVRAHPGVTSAEIANDRRTSATADTALPAEAPCGRGPTGA